MMNPWVLFPVLMLALGTAAGWLSRRLPPSGWAALALTAVPLGGAGLMALF
jgi:hypothetical protein